MTSSLPPAGPHERLTALRQRIAAGEGEAALPDLDRLRAEHPLDHEIAFYWCDVALRRNLAEPVLALAEAMRRASGSGLLTARWREISGIAAMLRADFHQADAFFSGVLDSLLELAAKGQIPALQPPPARALGAERVAAAEQRLWQILSSLATAGCAAFPLFGTLLGLVREGHLLPFDKDLDLGVWQEDFRGCCRQLRELGLHDAPMSPPYDNFASFIDPHSRLSFDVSGLRREPEHPRVVSGFWLYGRPPDHQRISVLPWFELEPRSTPAGQVWWPTPAEALLAAIYGDWRTPRAEWDTLLSAPNLQSGTLSQRCYGQARLANHWLHGDLARARRYLEQLQACLPEDERLARCRRSLDTLLNDAGALPAGSPPDRETS